MPKVNQGKPADGGVALVEPDEIDEVAEVIEPQAAEIVTDDDLDIPGGGVSFESLAGSGAVPAVLNEEDYAVDTYRSSPFEFDANPDFDQSEVDIPRLKLLQGQSPELQEGIGKVGWWYLQGQADALETVTFLPTGLIRTRERRPKNPDGSQGIVLCQSQDFHHGIGDPGGACKVCPMQQWGERDPATGKGTPPQCSAIYTYMGVIMECDEIGILTLKSTGMKAAKWINAVAVKKKGFGSFAVRLGSKLDGSGTQKWFVPVPSLAVVPKEEIDQAKALMF